MANLDGRETPNQYEYGISLQGQPNVGPIMPRPFGGVARDVKWMTAPIRGDAFWDKESNVTRAVYLPVTTAFFSLDMPLSLVGDILSLPKTIPYLWMNEEDYRLQVAPTDANPPLVESGKQPMLP